MRILMFGWEFPPFNSGGLGVACWGLTQALAKNGTQVVFVLPKKYNLHSHNLKFVFADTENIKLKEVNSLLKPYLTSDSYENERSMLVNSIYGNSLLEEVLRYGKAAGEIAKQEPHDVIHAHDWLSFPAGVEAKRVSRKPLLAHVHATEYDRTGGRGINHEVFRIEKLGMKHADMVIAVSNFTKNIIVDHYGINADKVKVVHNGINPDDYKESLSSENLLKLKEFGYNIVLFAGRITLQKGPDYFLHTAKRVLEYVPNTIFIVAGSGDMEYQIIRQAAQLGISDKVTFPGYLRGKDLNKVYQSADILVMPSVSEPFGITALESLANRTPVLISNQSGVSEVLTHALKADFWDVDEMVNKLVVLLRHKSLYHCLRENGTKEVQSLHWDRAAQKCMNMYTEMIGRHQ